MGWEAYITKGGQYLEINQRQIVDPILREVFLEASAEVKQLSGFFPSSFTDGCLDGFSSQLVLARATGIVCFDKNNEIGEINWSSAYVQQLQLKANWDIPIFSFR